jgi:hypothetical protein
VVFRHGAYYQKFITMSFPSFDVQYHWFNQSGGRCVPEVHKLRIYSLGVFLPYAIDFPSYTVTWNKHSLCASCQYYPFGENIFEFYKFLHVTVCIKWRANPFYISVYLGLGFKNYNEVQRFSLRPICRTTTISKFLTIVVFVMAYLQSVLHT